MMRPPGARSGSIVTPSRVLLSFVFISLGFWTYTAFHHQDRVLSAAAGGTGACSGAGGHALSAHFPAHSTFKLPPASSQRIALRSLYSTVAQPAQIAVASGPQCASGQTPVRTQHADVAQPAFRGPAMLDSPVATDPTSHTPPTDHAHSRFFEQRGEACTVLVLGAPLRRRASTAPNHRSQAAQDRPSSRRPVR